MQILINIDEDYVNIIKKNGAKNYFEDAVINGTPLPKGHGKIGDLDRLFEVFKKNVVGADAFKDLFDSAPTIIEADKKSE